MSYTIIQDKNFLKQIKKLEKEMQKRIYAVFDRIKIRPYPHVKKLVGNPYYSLRVGDYRVILDIVDDKLLIYTLELGHRKNVYKK